MSQSDRVQIFEVGPRDGLQNEPHSISFQTKTWFISSLLKSGVRDFEMGAFVRETRVPRMKDTPRLYRAISEKKIKLPRGARPWCLVPNLKGLDRAIESGAKSIAVFTASSNTFAEKNIGMSVKKSLLVFKEVIQKAKKNGMEVRGYVSTAFACPYEGRISPAKTLRVVEELASLGVFQVSIGDTIGVGTPGDVDRVVLPALKMLGKKQTAVHFHDTRGTALANALRAYEYGVRVFDSSAGGLGGCPYAPGASGNLATEDLVYLFHGMKITTGIDLDLLSSTSLKLAKILKRAPQSRYLQAISSQKRKS